ncbi:MAG: Rieske (2Fe-2S) protein [Dehalococcoidia bacterium]
MSPFLAFIGVSILGTWGLASMGLIAGGIFLLVDPEDVLTASDPTVGGIVLIVIGLISLLAMGPVLVPLLGLDPPFPISARKIVPAGRLTRWAKAGNFREFPDGTPKEVRVLSQRVLIIRQGDTVQAMSALCSHARLPMGGFAGSPIKADRVRDDCVMCPFHGARFEVATGKVVRQPFDSQFNAEHPILGGLQKKLFAVLSKLPAPPGMPKPSMKAEDMQTYPCRIEDGVVMVGLPK